MQPRLNYFEAAPDGLKAMLGLEQFIRACGLERPLIELVKVRTSQINGCAYCIDMHWKDARAAGETEQRLYGLSAWRESPYYTDRERAALGWTESLTLLSRTGAPDADFAPVREHFGDKDLANLTLAIAAINAWNRLAVGFRSPAGTYQPPKR